MNLSIHPCFNDRARHTFGRVHLPVAPRCNMQCRFCSRKYDCVNESRPGVTTGVLSPAQALVYLNAIVAQKNNILVVGIAGPGDPFARDGTAWIGKSQRSIGNHCICRIPSEKCV